jgi:predicted CXXCH cytochrome family protein
VWKSVELGLIVLLALACVAQDEDKGPRFFRPLDHSVLKPGPLSVIARTDGPAKLLVDGKQIEAKTPAPNVLAATVSLTPGPHELSFGDRKITVFCEAQPNSAPAGFQPFHAHPPGGAPCEACHAVKDGAWSIKGVSTAENCLVCHDRKTFPEVHTHIPKTLEECQMCHMPHGSTAAKHLKFDRETACKLCHG